MTDKEFAVFLLEARSAAQATDVPIESELWSRLVYPVTQIGFNRLFYYPTLQEARCHFGLSVMEAMMYMLYCHLDKESNNPVYGIWRGKVDAFINEHLTLSEE